ncbi:MAG TPA: hypothetical protein VIR54_11250 [Vicinamibacterales bacterium]
MPTPTFVQGVMTNNSRLSAMSVLHLALPNKALAGNCLVLGVAWGANSGTPSIAISDDQGNTWTTGPTHFDSGNTYHLSTWYALNVAAGTRQITVTATGGDLIFVQAQASEFYNVALSAASDGSANAHGNSSTWSPGSMTTTTDGDLVVSWAVDSGGNWPYGNFTPGPSFALCNADRLTGMVSQYRVQTTHGAITASATASKSVPFISCALALKPASAGTAPTADPRILRVTWADAVGSTFVQQAPSDGNIRAVGWVGVSGAGATRNMTGITETGGATYTRTTGVGNGQSGLAQWGYATGASASATNAITITSGLDNLSTAVIYDILATGATFDTEATATGSQTDSGDLTTVSLTPTNANGIVLCALGINSGTIRDLVGSGYQADNPWTAEEDGGGNVLHQDNGWGHTFNSSTSAVTFVWTNSNSGVGEGTQDWAADAISFSAAGAGGTSFTLNLSGAVSTSGTATKLAKLAKGGAATTTGATAKRAIAAKAGSVTASGTVSMLRAVLLVLAGSVAAAGSLARSIAKALTGSSTLTGSPAKQSQKATAGSVTASGIATAIKVILLALAGSLAPSGSIRRAAIKALAGSLTTSGAPSKAITATKTGALTAAGALARASSKALAGSVTIAGALTKLAAKAISALITAAGAFTSEGGTPSVVTATIIRFLPDRIVRAVFKNHTTRATFLDVTTPRATFTSEE